MNVETLNVKIYNTLLGNSAKGSKLCRVKWLFMIIIQELFKCKFKAIFKVFYNKTYRNDIYTLCKLLTARPLTSRPGMLSLKDIHFSHEINYPEWVDYLCFRFDTEGKEALKPLKVLHNGKKWIVVDGNHRLQAAKMTFSGEEKIRVKVLTYRY